jgi:uroporphyrinogen-III synthase
MSYSTQPGAGASPLAGRRGVVTRPRAQAQELCDRLEGAGARVLVSPAIRIEPVHGPDVDAMVRACAAERGDRAIVFTSRNAVASFLDAAGRAGLDAGAFAGALVAAVGPATAAALVRAGLEAGIVASPHTAEGLAAAMAAARVPLAHYRVFYPRAEGARETIAAVLAPLGVQVEDAVFYRSVAVAIDAAALDPAPEVITFASPSAVEAFSQALPRELGETIRRDALAACIGPVTAEAARRLGHARVLTARVHTAEGLVAALAAHFEKER